MIPPIGDLIQFFRIDEDKSEKDRQEGASYNETPPWSSVGALVGRLDPLGRSFHAVKSRQSFAFAISHGHHR